MKNIEIEEILDYLSFGEDADIIQKVNRVREYILFLEYTRKEVIEYIENHPVNACHTLLNIL